VADTTSPVEGSPKQTVFKPDEQ